MGEFSIPYSGNDKSYNKEFFQENLSFLSDDKILPEYRIMTCIHNKNIITYKTKGEEKKYSNSIEDLSLNNAKLINYDNHNGYHFIIGDIDESDKYSLDYLNCTSIIAVGKSKKSGKNISFLSHQHPDSVQQKFFKKEITEKINKLIRLSYDDSIDIILLGGNSNNNYNQYFNTVCEIESILGNIIDNPLIISNGPSSIKKDRIFYEKDIFLDTQKRIVNIYKSHNHIESNITFHSKNIDDVLNYLAKTEK